jgi:amino acid adenylation domain-containing protein
MPLDPGYPEQRLAGYVQDVQPALLITQTKLACRAAALGGGSTKVLLLEELLAAAAPSSDAVAAVTVDLPARQWSDLAYIIFTSGSTGRPKSAAMEQHSLAEYCMSTIDMCGLDNSTVALTVSSISFDAHVPIFYPVLAAGGMLVLPRQEDHLNPQYLGDLITSQKVSYTLVVPAVASMLMQEPAFGEQHGSMKAVIVGGEPVSSVLLASMHKVFPGARLFIIYGPTEATVQVTSVEARHRGSAASPIGTPEANVQLYIVDEQLQLVPPGWPGELLVSGPRLGRGYINRPELTAEKFIPNPFLSDLLERSACGSCLPGARYLQQYYHRAYRKGDLARLRGDGSLEYLGRIDRQVRKGLGMIM